MHRVVSEGDLCRRGGPAGPRDAAIALLLGARSARDVSRASRRSPPLPRKVGARPADGRPVLLRRPHVVKQAAGRARARLVAARRAAHARVRAGRAAGVRFSAGAGPSAPPAASCRSRRAAGRDDAVPEPRSAADRRREPRARRPSTSSKARSSTTGRSGTWTRRRPPIVGRRCSIRSWSRRSSTSRTSTTSGTSSSRPRRCTKRRSGSTPSASRRTSISATSTTISRASRKPSRAYRDALTINPGYPEAHFYLAVTLEKLGRSDEAKQHWRETPALAPDGEFVTSRREFSD